ncbi:MAG: DUF1566 domain-containing protein [Desulfatibacillum sp.]|nr:DUF1566 domain-containing protein [Desulfatibacillum sp.]
MPLPITTDQTQCYAADGSIIPCQGTGQDGETRAGQPWPEPRFSGQGPCILDNLTGLMWTRDANPLEFPLTWDEAQQAVDAMNVENAHGYSDWRLPSRRQLFSLLSHTRINPALPQGHPFENVFSGYCWTSDTCARFPGQAWYAHLGGGRVFTGMKHGSYMVWPVRAGEVTQISAAISSLDRFIPHGAWVEDSRTGLFWTRDAAILPAPVTWTQALDFIHSLNNKNALGFSDWRLPNVRELESLVDATAHSPALAQGHPFESVCQGYWSSTTSVYDSAYAWTLYTRDGRVGVGFKTGADFQVWPIRNP